MCAKYDFLLSFISSDCASCSMEGGGLPSGLSLGDQGCEQVDLVAPSLLISSESWVWLIPPLEILLCRSICRLFVRALDSSKVTCAFVTLLTVSGCIFVVDVFVHE